MDCDHIWLPIALGKMCQRCNLYVSDHCGLRMTVPVKMLKKLSGIKENDDNGV